MCNGAKQYRGGRVNVAEGPSLHVSPCGATVEKQGKLFKLLDYPALGLKDILCMLAKETVRDL